MNHFITSNLSTFRAVINNFNVPYLLSYWGTWYFPSSIVIFSENYNFGKYFLLTEIFWMRFKRQKDSKVRRESIIISEKFELFIAVVQLLSKQICNKLSEFNSIQFSSIKMKTFISFQLISWCFIFWTLKQQLNLLSFDTSLTNRTSWIIIWLGTALKLNGIYWNSN